MNLLSDIMSTQKDHRKEKEDIKEEKADEVRPSETVTITKEEYEGLLKVSQDVADIQDKLLRLGAEFENYKKRSQRDREEFLKYTGEAFVLEILYVIDNFERAFQASEKTQDFKVLHQGVEMILKEAQKFLKDKGVKKIDSVGLPFDPHRHEAIENVIFEDKPENMVVEECQAGYEMNGRIIRPAKVRISKKDPQSTEQNPQ